MLTNWTTLTVMSGIVWVVTTLVTVITLLTAWTRPSYPGWSGWAAGHGALMFGLLTGALRTPESLLFSVFVGNALVMAGAVLYLQAFQRFIGISPARHGVWPTWVLLALILLALYVLTTVWPSILVRFLLVGGFLLTINVQLLSLITRQIRRNRRLRSSYTANLIVLLLMNVTMVPRTMMMLGGASGGAFSLNVPNVLMYCGVLLLSVGGAFAFWLLHDDRRRLEMQDLHDQLLFQARQDPLTGLLNRRGLEEAFSRWSADPSRDSAAVLVMDINRFKEINDRQGHAAGDACLVRLAEALRVSVRSGDVLSRTGGDEFVVLLVGSPLQMEQGVRALTARLTHLALGFTVSVGDVLIRPGEDLASVMGRADRAMYAQKQLSKQPGSLRRTGWSGVRVQAFPR